MLFSKPTNFGLLITLFTNFQDLDNAKDYFKRKVDFVGEQMEKIEILGFEKSKIR